MNIGKSRHNWNSLKLIHNRHIDIRGTFGNHYILRTMGHEYITGTWGNQYILEHFEINT